MGGTNGGGKYSLYIERKTDRESFTSFMKQPLLEQLCPHDYTFSNYEAAKNIYIFMFMYFLGLGATPSSGITDHYHPSL